MPRLLVRNAVILDLRMPQQKLIDVMLTFHLHPSQEVFDMLLETEQPLYTDVKEPDDPYYELEGEKWWRRNKRIQEWKENVNKAKSKYPNSRKPVFSNPVILSWVYACTKQFPWLMENCKYPLYLERAFKFNISTYASLQTMVSLGITVYTDKDGSVEDAVSARVTYKQDCTAFIMLTLIRFGASGDKWYLDHVRDIVSAEQCGIEKLNRAMTQIKKYYNLDDMSLKHDAVIPSAEDNINMIREFVHRVDPNVLPDDVPMFHDNIEDLLADE